VVCRVVSLELPFWIATIFSHLCLQKPLLTGPNPSHRIVFGTFIFLSITWLVTLSAHLILPVWGNIISKKFNIFCALFVWIHDSGSYISLLTVHNADAVFSALLLCWYFCPSHSRQNIYVYTIRLTVSILWVLILDDCIASLLPGYAPSPYYISPK